MTMFHLLLSSGGALFPDQLLANGSKDTNANEDTNGLSSRIAGQLADPGINKIQPNNWPQGHSQGCKVQNGDLLLWGGCVETRNAGKMQWRRRGRYTSFC